MEKLKKYSGILKDNKYVILYSFTERLFFFLAFLIIARKFPPDLYGQIITIFSLANIFIILFDLGLPILIQKEVAVLKERSSGIISNVFTLFVISFPLYFITAIIYSKIFFPEISVLMITLILISVYFFSAGSLFNKLL